MHSNQDETAPSASGDVAAPLADRSAPPPWYRRKALMTCGGVVVAAALAIGIPVIATAGTSTSSGLSVISGTTTSEVESALPTQTSPDGTAFRSPRTDPRGGQGDIASPDRTSTSPSIAEATLADDAESTGVAIIETVLGYEGSSAAGTGMVVSSDGLVLTNHHVVEGATEISVTIATTGQTFVATLVGSDSEDDVALLQLEGAAGLDTVEVDDDGEAVGDAVTAVGNAEGGGVLLAADGLITALNQTVTTSATAGSASESLDGMIEIAADVVSGDSGGALLDAEGEVIGMTTAASTGSATTIAYAVPIEDALAIAQQILGGDETDGVSIGYPAFLGVQTTQATGDAGSGRPQRGYAQPGTTNATTSGATLAGVIEGTPAADAGLAAGDTITGIDGVAVTDASALSVALAAYAPGDTVTLTWTDGAGSTHSAAVTLIAGPVG